MDFLVTQFGHSCGCGGLGAWTAACALVSALVGVAALAAAALLMARSRDFEADLTSMRYANKKGT
jgi:hypothetical protein